MAQLIARDATVVKCDSMECERERKKWSASTSCGKSTGKSKCSYRSRWGFNTTGILIKCHSGLSNIVHVKAITARKAFIGRRTKESHRWILQHVAKKFRAAKEDLVNNSSSVFRGSFFKMFSQTFIWYAKYFRVNPFSPWINY